MTESNQITRIEESESLKFNQPEFFTAECEIDQLATSNELKTDIVQDYGEGYTTEKHNIEIGQTLISAYQVGEIIMGLFRCECFAPETNDVYYQLRPVGSGNSNEYTPFPP